MQNKYPLCTIVLEVPFGHLMPRQQKQYSFDGQLGSMSSMQDHFNSAVVPTKDWVAKKVTIFNSIVHLVKTSENILSFYLHFT